MLAAYIPIVDYHIIPYVFAVPSRALRLQISCSFALLLLDVGHCGFSLWIFTVPTMLQFILSFFLHHWLSALLFLVIARLGSNYCHHGLNKYPGPLLASLTDIWRFVDVWRRRPDITHIKLHRKYGDIVRLGPNTLSFGNPLALKEIYGLNKGFIKV